MSEDLLLIKTGLHFSLIGFQPIKDKGTAQRQQTRSDFTVNRGTTTPLSPAVFNSESGEVFKKAA